MVTFLPIFLALAGALAAPLRSCAPFSLLLAPACDIRNGSFPMRIRVFFHDKCFDGAASAAVFSRFYKSKINSQAVFEYTGLAHRASQLFDEDKFDGEENAIVDFKYTASPKLTWWFDHHQSAFLSAEDQQHFLADRGGKKFFDPSYKSCTKFIATVAKEKFGFAAPDLDDLVKWADIVDGAQYADSATAVRMEAPATKLTLVIEASKDDGLLPRLIPMMGSMPLASIVEDPGIQALFRPLYERHIKSIDVIRQRASCHDGVISFDLSDVDLEGYSKFIPYDLFPEGVYNVSISTASYRTKISVGSNPWNTRPKMHNLATICESYGGGGHPRVGAISFEAGAVEKARAAAKEIVALLKTEPE